MGGLVASHLLRNIAVRTKIDKLITLGTPFLGTLLMLPPLIDGDASEVAGDMERYLRHLNPWFREHIAEPALQLAIRSVVSNMPSVYEMLPNRRFFSLDNRTYLTVYRGDRAQISATFNDTEEHLNTILRNQFNRALFREATNNNSLLWEANRHVTENVRSYYIAGEGEDTMDRFIFREVRENYSFTHTKAGDGLALTYSASMHGKRLANRRVESFFVSVGHFALIEHINVITFVRSIIDGNTGIGGSTLLTSGIRDWPDHGFG
jgi:hypothetical protein